MTSYNSTRYNDSTSSTSTSVRLPQPLPSLCIGATKIRFIVLTEGNKAEIQVRPGIQGVHLFLAADVLANSKYLKENQPRVHARFAKKGLATKVHFQQDLMLEGIHGLANGIWFYSIQGVFRVIFEFHDRIQQLHCLHSFSELWKSSINDPVLSSSIKVHMQFQGQNSLELPSASNVEQHIQVFSQQTEEEFTSTDLEHLNVGCVVSVQTEDFQEHVSKSNPESWLSKLTGCLTNLENTCPDDKSLQLLQILKGILGTLCKSDVNPSLFELLHLLTENIVNEKFISDEWGDQTILCIISKWLGTQFCKFASTISARVQEFKSKNIDHIDDLPPAGELVSHLFPPAMSCLLVNWMGIEENTKGQTGHPKWCKDTKGKEDGMRSEKNQTEAGVPPSHLYPLVQIVLEFANQTLISGVAHVLFTRLIH